MRTESQYHTYLKPSWAPPSWLFAPVWTMLYIIIAISYGYATYAYLHGDIPLIVLVPFVLNLIFNFAYTPIQFGLRNFVLATVDIFLVLGTLIWALTAIYTYIPLISYVNIPYLAWVGFATILQIAVTAMNRSKKAH